MVKDQSWTVMDRLGDGWLTQAAIASWTSARDSFYSGVTLTQHTLNIARTLM